MPRRRKDEKYKQMYSDYLDGMSLEQVGDKWGITRQAVYAGFKRRGCQLRGPNFRPYQYFDDKKFTLRDSGYYALTTGDRTLMHRYVWMYYNGPIPEGHDIHHKDEIKANNEIENLECLPKSEHTRKYSPHNNQYGEGCRPVKMIKQSGEEVVFDCTSRAAEQIGITRSAINQCINGKTNTCNGCNWEYA